MLYRFHAMARFPERPALHAVGVALLLAYLLLFSVASLVHVYQANELIDADGCAIGSWLHLGQQAVLLLLVYVVTAPAGLVHRLLRSPLRSVPFGNDSFKRGPPSLPAFG